MSDRSNPERNETGLLSAHVDWKDANFGRGSDAEFHESSRQFKEAFDIEDVEDAVELGTGNVGYDLNDLNESRDFVGEYVNAVGQWHKGSKEGHAKSRTSDDATKIANLRKKRLATSEAILKNEQLADPRLEGVRKYLAADLAYLQRPDASTEAYDDFLSRRTKLRELVFGENYQVGEEIYTESTRAIQYAIASEAHINDQYDLIDIRREAALEHFDDPRFIASVGTHKNNYLDEMLVDFDRGDLLTTGDSATQQRSAAMAEIFKEKIEMRPARSDSVSAKVKAFQEWRELGKDIRHNQLAIVGFARSNMEDSAPVGDSRTEAFRAWQETGDVNAGSRQRRWDPTPGGATFELGMAALDNETYGPGLWKEWGQRFSDKDAAKIGSSATNVFMAARQAFEKEFDQGDPEAAKSFAVMERAASQILQSDKMVRKLAEMGNLEDVEALHVFHPERARKRFGAIPEKFEEAILDRLGIDAKSGEHGQRSGSAVALDGEATAEYDLGLEKTEGSFFAARDEEGGLRVARTREDFEKGAFVEMRNLEAADLAQAPNYSLMPAGESGEIRMRRDDEGKIRAWRSDQPGEGGGFSLLEKGKATEHPYKLDLEAAGKNSVYEISDGGFLRVSNSKEDMEQGRFLDLRIAGMTAPPVGTMTGNNEFDAGLEAKDHMASILNRHGRDSLSLSIEQMKSGEKVLRARLSSGEDLGQRMIRDGYALPTMEEDGAIRREHMAKQAEANNRGLWAEGFPQENETWKTEKRLPGLRGMNRKDKLENIVNRSMASSPAGVRRHLMDPASKLFALPLQDWVGDGRIDREVMRIAKTNPTRLMEMYNGNMEILRDLRKRKDKLTRPEKVIHDKLSIGRRVLGDALVETGHLSAEQSRKDGHPLMSARSMKLHLEKLRPVGTLAGNVVRAAEATAKEGAQKGGESIKKIFAQAVDADLRE